MKSSELGELTKPVKKWNPVQSEKKEPFCYIDLSSVDQKSKQIKQVSSILPQDAPSRARQLVSTGDVLVSTVRPNLNGVAYVSSDFTGATSSTGFCVLRPKEDTLDGRYLYHWVQSPQFVGKMILLATGASYPAVSDRIVKSSKIPLPSLPEQKRIAAILDKADTIRGKRQAAIKLADDFLRATFLDMFGDPGTNPKGWKTATLGNFIHSAKDGPHVSPKYSIKGIPFLSTRHVRPGKIIWKDLKYISHDEAERQWKKCKPEKGDILYTKGGTTGIAAVLDSDKEIAIWVHVALLKTNHDMADSVWLENMLNTAYCYLQSQHLTHGITNKDLGLKRMVNIKMYSPPLEIQKKFSKIVTAVRDSMSRHIDHANESNSLFNSLIQRAFRGDL